MIKLLLAIFVNILFLSSFWVCEAMYPGFDQDWAIFILMDMMQHNFYAVMIFTALIISCLKTKYWITDYFIYLCCWFSFFDVLDRLAFQTYEFTAIDRVFTIPASFVLAGLAFYYVKRE